MFTHGYPNLTVVLPSDHDGVYDGEVWYGEGTQDMRIRTKVEVGAFPEKHSNICVQCPECKLFSAIASCYQHVITHISLRETTRNGKVYACKKRGDETYHGTRPAVRWGAVIPSGRVYGRLTTEKCSWRTDSYVQCSRYLRWYRDGGIWNAWKHHKNIDNCDDSYTSISMQLLILSLCGVALGIALGHILMY